MLDYFWLPEGKLNDIYLSLFVYVWLFVNNVRKIEVTDGRAASCEEW